MAYETLEWRTLIDVGRELEGHTIRLAGAIEGSIMEELGRCVSFRIIPHPESGVIPEFDRDVSVLVNFSGYLPDNEMNRLQMIQRLEGNITVSGVYSNNHDTSENYAGILNADDMTY